MPQRYNIVSEQHLADALIFSLRNGLIYSRFPSYAANSHRISVVRSKFIWGFEGFRLYVANRSLIRQPVLVFRAPGPTTDRISD